MREIFSSLASVISRAAHFLLLVLALTIGLSTAAHAANATCGYAGAQGTYGPADWQTYCWLDFSTYVDGTATSSGGQNFSYTLSDGSTLTFNLKVSTPSNSALVAVASPSWGGAAFGNTAFLNIPNKPILYTQNAGTVTFAISNIVITPPSGVSASTLYSFVAADGESTNNGESLSWTTNGTNWTILDQAPQSASGTVYPTIPSSWTTNFTETGVAGTVGAYIVGSTSPTSISTTMVAGGLQGTLFAVRFATIRLNKLITGARVNAADQFTFNIKTTSSGTVLATGTTSGTGNGPFTAAAVSLASALPLTLNETMAAGSSSALTAYNSSLSCTNSNSGSSTVLPTNVITTSYNFGTLAFGDAIQCTFTNGAFPRIALSKALAAARIFTNDQFILNIANGATVAATITTTGAGTTVSNGTTPATQLTSGTAYTLNEAASGSTNLSYYAAALSCSNSASTSTTTLPTTVPGTITPVLGDIITCTLTNTPKASTATLVVTKTAIVISDPVNGTTNPKKIPGAVIQYTVNITNTGTLAVDSSSVVMTDPLPSNVTYYASTSLGGPVAFVDGSPVSGLSFSQSNVKYQTSASAGSYVTYTPVLDANGYDANIKGIRAAPTGIMNGATAAGQPSFSFQYRVKIN